MVATPWSSYLNTTSWLGLKPASITCQYSLYVMVEMHSACFWISGSTLKPCLSIFTPPGEPSVLYLSFAIQDRNGYSLPKNHTPIVLPLRSPGDLMPVSARQVISRPDFLNGCEMFTS